MERPRESINFQEIGDISSSDNKLIAGRYYPIERLGKGGIGEVWLCFDHLFDREVALKRLLPKNISTTNLNCSLYKEAQALSLLNHPNIVKVYDFSSSNNTHYLVLEYIPGISLAELWKQYGWIEWPLLAEIADQILAALAHAHSKGIIHKDLKPSNIILHSENNGELRVHVIDFGTSFFQNNIISILRQNEYKKLSFSHSDFLTPSHAPLEQIQTPLYFQGVGTDLYALGVILYQFCSGRLPYSGKSVQEIRDAMLNKTLLPFQAKNNAPPEVGSLIFRLLSNHPLERGLFAIDIRRELRQYWDPKTSQGLWKKFLDKDHDNDTQHVNNHEILREETHLLKQEPYNEFLNISYSSRELNSYSRPASLGKLDTTRMELRSHASSTLSHRKIPSKQMQPFVEGENSFQATSLTRGIAHQFKKEPEPLYLPSLDLLTLQLPALESRKQEKEELLKEIEEVVEQGHQKFILIEGASGVGKSRLVQWVMEQVHEEGRMVGLRISCRHNQEERGLVHAFKKFFSFNELNQDYIEKALRFQYGDIEALDGVIQALHHLFFLQPKESNLSERLEAFVKVLSFIKSKYPLIVWFDDIAEANSRELEFVKILFKQSWDILVLATFNREESEEALLKKARIEEFLKEIEGKKVTLHPLTKEQLKEMFEPLLTLEEEALDFLYEKSKGLPALALTQICNWLKEKQIWWDKEESNYQLRPTAWKRPSE